MNKDSEILKNLKNKMDGTISSLNHSLSGLRTGRASTALLDPIKVDAYGSDMFLNQIGSISAPDAKTLSIQIWDKGLVSSAEKAILNSTQFVANLKYKYLYDFSVTQTLYVINDRIRKYGINPQIRADFDGDVKVKSILVHIS
jgi:hypothetical protein